MKPTVPAACGVLLIAAAFLAGPGHAEDRELQAILEKLRCVPSKVTPISLAPTVTAYDVLCKGSDKVIHVICRESECRLQPKPSEDEER
ncbi:MAG: hypothetical protein HYX38_03130 [Rhodospirillales bacterium]|nr:hypothetical protein [Rhodospirillales bacterium]